MAPTSSSRVGSETSPTVPGKTAPLPQGPEKVRAVRAMFDAIAPRYDVVNRLMTFRMDVGWRRRTVAALDLSPGSLVLDLACGTGDLCRVVAAAGHWPVGADLSLGMLAEAGTDAPLVQADALADGGRLLRGRRRRGLPGLRDLPRGGHTTDGEKQKQRQESARHNRPLSS
jgi:demethylmenaquinone methyltransferase/2-methoxy-6-polyprenyl-1,4-benzoquinol methylase